jgi:hypothetical protein
MEELSTGDWSLIARYLSEEASEGDLVRLDRLAHRTKNLREEMEALRKRMNVPVTPGPNVFNADPAFDKLHQRLKAEGLI